MITEAFNIVIGLTWALWEIFKCRINKIIFVEKYNLSRSSPSTSMKRTNSAEYRDVEIRDIYLRRSKITVSYAIVESSRNDGLKQYGLILHDFPDSPRNWLQVMERLDDNFTFVCPNLNIRSANVDLKSVVNEIIEELCNAESVFLIGCGMGAVLSWALLGKRPDLATKLIVLSEGHRTRLKALIPPERLINSTSLTSKLFELNDYELLKQYLRKRNINETGIDRILTDVQLKNDLSARFHYWKSVNSMRRGRNSKIQAPVLALVGEADPDCRNILHSLMECSTSLTTVQIKGTTLMHATSPKNISYQINNFIRTNFFVPTVRFRMNA